MIAYIEGTVLHTESTHVVIKTASGLGYAVHAPQNLLASCKIGQSLEAHIHTHVREDDLTLFGFRDLQERTLFEMMIKTSGIGPKLALAVLSVMNAPELVGGVQRGDTDQFSKVPGIGKKTAAKLCLDMSDQLKRHPLAGLGAENTVGHKVQHEPVDLDGVLSALKNMGLAEREILPVLNQLNPADSFEERFKKALSLLNPMR